VSNNRIYEIDMNFTTGKDYRSAIFLLKELTNGSLRLKLRPGPV